MFNRTQSNDWVVSQARQERQRTIERKSVLPTELLDTPVWNILIGIKSESSDAPYHLRKLASEVGIGASALNRWLDIMQDHKLVIINKSIFGASVKLTAEANSNIVDYFSHNPINTNMRRHLGSWVDLPARDLFKQAFAGAAALAYYVVLVVPPALNVAGV